MNSPHSLAGGGPEIAIAQPAFKRGRGEFADPRLEVAFARWSWPEWSRTARLAMVLGGAATWALAYSDFLFVGATPTLLGLWALRITQTVLCVWAFGVLGRPSGRKVARWAMIPWITVTVLIIYVIGLSRPPDFLVYFLQIMAVILAIYTIVPRQLVATTAIMGAVSVLNVGTVIWRGGTAFPAILALIFAFTAFNGFGYLIGLRGNLYRRRDFAARLNDRKVTRRLRDEIRRRTLVEADLVKAKGAAEAASRAKTEFLAAMSHELRTPLNAIANYTMLMADTLGDRGETTLLEDLARIDVANRHLTTLINNALDLAKIEAGTFDLMIQPIALGAFLAELGAIIAQTIDPARQRFSTEIVGEPGEIDADVLRLRQALLNLLSNAVKFTDEGAITLRLTGAPGSVRFDVIDTGVGIEPETLATVFDAVHASPTGAGLGAGGTGRGIGLGLKLSRDLVTLMGGTVSVTSAPGQGSCFTIHLPRHRGAIGA